MCLNFFKEEEEEKKKKKGFCSQNVETLQNAAQVKTLQGASVNSRWLLGVGFPSTPWACLLTPLPGRWEWNPEGLWALASLTFPWHVALPLLETALHFLHRAGVVVATRGPGVNEADVRVIYHLTAPTPPDWASHHRDSLPNQPHQLHWYPTIKSANTFLLRHIQPLPGLQHGLSIKPE